jgi:hypothetical protein
VHEVRGAGRLVEGVEDGGADRPTSAMAVTGGAVLVSAGLLARHVRVPPPSTEAVSSAAAVPSGR